MERKKTLLTHSERKKIPTLNFAELFRREGKYPESLLDIGCGPCLEGEQFLVHGIFLTGVDQDGETIREVQNRLPKGKFVAADAAFWLEKVDHQYDAVLIRCPDLIFRSENWHTVFRRIPYVLKHGGRVIVTTPGESEARICAGWLREIADSVRLSKTGISEEAFLVRAEKVKKIEKKKTARDRLIQSLSWQDEEPQMVCDLRTGLCTAITDKEVTTDETKQTGKE
jgi:trans-aconitate methyltransferase